MEPDNTAIGIRFPSTLEIGGLVIALIPFVLSVSNVTSETVNGHVTRFEYRDWIAISCGGIAALAGIASALRLRRTDAPERTKRALAVIALLGLGAFQIARGFGVVGVDRPDDVEAAAEVPPPARTIDPAPVPVVDLLGPTRRLFDAWRDGRLRQIYDGAHPELREVSTFEQLEHIQALFTEAAGRFVKIADQIESGRDGELRVARGDAIYERGTLAYAVKYKLVDGKPLVIFIDLRLPAELQRKPSPAEAEKVARRLLDRLLAGKLERDLLSLQTRAKVADAFEDKLRDVLKRLGKVKRIGAPKSRACDGACFTYEVAGAKAKATFTADLEVALVRWEVESFELNLP